MKQCWIWIGIFAFAIVAVVIWKYWPRNNEKKNDRGADAVNEQGNKNKEDEKREIAVQEEEVTCPDGQTMANIDSGVDYRASVVNYYLSYAGCGKSDIEKIDRHMYEKFITDYPTGIAEGNVINKYLS